MIPADLNIVPGPPAAQVSTPEHAVAAGGDTGRAAFLVAPLVVLDLVLLWSVD